MRPLLAEPKGSLQTLLFERSKCFTLRKKLIETQAGIPNKKVRRTAEEAQEILCC